MQRIIHITSARLYSNVIIVKWNPMQHEPSLGLCMTSAVPRWEAITKSERKVDKSFSLGVWVKTFYSIQFSPRFKVL